MFRQDKGFTLVEVIVSVFIIGIAVTGLVMGFSYGLGLVEEVSEISTVDRIMQEKMEELRGGIIDIPGPPDYSNTFPESSYTVTITATSIQPALTKVTVTVSWNSHTGKNISRSLVTYFTENGITKTSD